MLQFGYRLGSISTNFYNYAERYLGQFFMQQKYPKLSISMQTCI